MLHWHTHAASENLVTRFSHAALTNLYEAIESPVVAIHSWGNPDTEITYSRLGNGTVGTCSSWRSLAQATPRALRVLVRPEPGGAHLAFGCGQRLPSAPRYRLRWAELHNPLPTDGERLPEITLYPRLTSERSRNVKPDANRIGIRLDPIALGQDHRLVTMCEHLRASIPEKHLIPLFQSSQFSQVWSKSGGLWTIGAPIDFDVPKLHGIGKLIILSSDMGEAPVVLEALERGCHVIAPKTAAYRNYLDESRGSFWSGDPRDIADLVEIIRQSRQDPSSSRKASAWSRRRSLSRSAAKLTPILRQAVETFGQSKAPRNHWVLRREYGIGDVIFTLTVAWELRKRDPTAKITVHTHPDNAAWVRWFPFIDSVTSGPFSSKITDRVADFENAFPSGSALDRCLALGAFVGVRPTEWAPSPEIPLALRERMRRRFRTDRPRIVFVSSCRGRDHARSLPAAVADETAVRLCELGEVAWIDEQPRERPPLRGVRDLTGKLTISKAFALIAEADLCVSVDTGLLHVAITLGKPVVGLFSHIATLQRLSLAPRFVALEPNLPCSPCGEGPGAFHCEQSAMLSGKPLPVRPCIAVHSAERTLRAAELALQSDARRVWSVGPDGACSEWDLDSVPGLWVPDDTEQVRSVSY